MTPAVVVDVGNSRVKWGRVADGRVAEVAAFAHDDAVGWKRQCELWGLAPPAHWALAGVVPETLRRLQDWVSARGMTADTITSELFARPGPLAFATTVKHPGRIGVDRLLTAYAAWRRTPLGTSAVALNIGTAMTIDFVGPYGVHRGGAILPGPRLMARSLHEHTAKLPQVEIDPVLPVKIWGRDTEEAIELGIANAVVGAADQMVWDWASGQPDPPWVFATGGDVGYFQGFVFTADLGGFVIDRALTLDGIRLAAEALP